MEGLTTYYFLVCKDPRVNMLPLEEAGGLRVGPSTWAWLHSPCRSHISASSSGPESRDLTHTPKLSEP